MINFEKFYLSNGLKVIVHNDVTTPIVAFNILYNVGARDENPEKTGFAHLFEHLMFEGSVNIPNYDTPLQQAGGENNAFTNNNYTNYYLTLPKQNIETAFWLESDRMMKLALTQEKLDIQKKVVIEEFKQRYLNQPYADWDLYLRPLAYKKHPYRWSTIGKELAHIEQVTFQQVEAFFNKYYAPNNAILVVAGDVSISEVKALAEKWFGDIPSCEVPVRDIPIEPKQMESRFEQLERDVPLNAIYQAYHMVDRLSPDYYATDLISDILSNGKSARLTERLVKDKQLFSSINAYITGDIDPGLFMVTGHINNGVTLEDAQEAIDVELANIINNEIDAYELDKVKNKVEANLVYSEIGILNKAMNLAYFELLGNIDLINNEGSNYQQISPKQIQQVAKNLFDKKNCSTLFYKAKQ